MVGIKFYLIKNHIHINMNFWMAFEWNTPSHYVYFLIRFPRLYFYCYYYFQPLFPLYFLITLSLSLVFPPTTFQFNFQTTTNLILLLLSLDVNCTSECFSRATCWVQFYQIAAYLINFEHIWFDYLPLFRFSRGLNKNPIVWILLKRSSVVLIIKFRVWSSCVWNIKLIGN